MIKLKAYTLIELLLSVGLISALLALSLPVFNSFQFRSELDSAELTTISALRSAQTFAQAVNGDSVWGVSLQSNTVIVFKGNSFAGRDTSFDNIYTFPANISSSGLSEVTYSKFLGLPSTTGNITLSHGTNSTQIAINEKGLLTY